MTEWYYGYYFEYVFSIYMYTCSVPIMEYHGTYTEDGRFVILQLCVYY